MKKLPPFLNCEQAAEVLDLPLQSVWKLCRQRRLPVVRGVRPYRIITAELMSANRRLPNENQAV